MNGQGRVVIEIMVKFCENIKSSCAVVSKQTVSAFHEYFKKTSENVPSSNKANYDEANLYNEPRRRKVESKTPQTCDKFIKSCNLNYDSSYNRQVCSTSLIYVFAYVIVNANR